MFSRISDFIERQSIVLRIGAIGLAFLLWIFVVSQNRFTYVIDVPIEARNLSAKKALKEEAPASAQVRFSGTGRALFKSWLLKDFYDEFKLVIDLERISEEHDFILNEYFSQYPQKVVIPNSFDITYIEVLYPRDVHIVLDEYLVKEVPIRSKILVEPLPGYVLIDNIQLNPSHINIAGPKETVQSIRYIETVSDTLNNLQFPVYDRIELFNPMPVIELSSNHINYTLDIQAISERIVSDIPVEVTRRPEGIRVFVNPRTVSLTLVGGVNQIESINPEDINVTIDFRDQWNAQTQFYEPSVSVPTGMRWQDLSPRNLELVVTKEVN